MLFNSFEFIFIFLPVVFCLFYLAADKLGNRAAILTLVIASLGFYAYWNPIYILLLLASMLVNFTLGRTIGRTPDKRLLILGIVFNLGLLGYYKYANFFVKNVNYFWGAQWDIGTILLPLAISFFTFQQIAYLVDSYRGITREYSALHYALFVSFFPQLIAGPIVHHKEMLPQFESTTRFRIDANNLIIGLSIFAVGLFKKTVIADGIAVHATPVFAAADAGTQLDLISAWSGALAYTFQLYFDFSGYSDMAIGLARLFGIVLPLNFYSPYKATNISEFWRRWHMTLSRFLRDYVYITLGGNRNGNGRRYINLIATMLLGGLWHGAGWNFVVWGALHGLYLSVNHAWQALLQRLGFTSQDSRWYLVFAWFITFIAVIVGWVFFRATTYQGAVSMIESMAGFNGVAIPNGILSRLGDIGELIRALGIQGVDGGGADFIKAWLWIAVLLPVVIMLPNTQDMFSRARGSLSKQAFVNQHTLWPLHKLATRIRWSDSSRWALLSGVMLALGVLTLAQVSEFLYFQF